MFPLTCSHRLPRTSASTRKSSSIAARPAFGRQRVTSRQKFRTCTAKMTSPSGQGIGLHLAIAKAPQRVAAHSNLCLNLKKCVLLRSPTSHNTDAPPSQSNNTPDILALHSAATVPPTGTFAHKSPQALRLAAPVLAQHRPHAEVEVTHLQCGLYSARDNGLESAALTKRHFDRLEAFHSEVRAPTSQPPLTHHIHTSTAEAFRAPFSIPSEQYRTELLFCCSCQYRGGAVGAGLRPGRRRVHWTEQCTKLLWH